MGLYRNLTAICSHMGCPTEAKKTIILNAVSITACLVHKVLKFLVCVTHDILT